MQEAWDIALDFKNTSAEQAEGGGGVPSETPAMLLEPCSIDEGSNSIGECYGELDRIGLIS